MFGFIEKFKLNSVWQYDWNVKKAPNTHHLIVGSINGKYGIIDNEDNVLIPFEYDNITRVGYEILQTVKGGKLGLIHVQNEQEEIDVGFGCPEIGRFYISKTIPCIYDSIESPMKEGVVFLSNYHHSGQSIQVYFTFARKFTEDSYSDYDITDKDEHLLNLYGKGRVFLFDYSNGKLLGSRIATMDDYKL